MATCTTITATLPSQDVYAGLGRDMTGKMVAAWLVLTTDTDGKPIAPIEARFYGGRGLTDRAAIRITTADSRYISAAGKTSGYGYCKESSAVADAIRRAGIDLSCQIDGRGDDAIRRALLAIAEAAGYTTATTVRGIRA